MVPGRSGQCPVGCIYHADGYPVAAGTFEKCHIKEDASLSLLTYNKEDYYG